MRVKNMIYRSATKALNRYASQFAVVGIIGPRQSGKSTLAKATFPDKAYVSFDNKESRELAAASPIDFLMAFPKGAIIDEAQKVPEIFEAIKYYVDNEPFEAGKYILTGSSQFKLRQNMADSLAGRIGILRLLPFTIEEISNSCLLPEKAYDFIVKGQYPPLYDKEKHFIPEDWYENYIDTYLDLDVRNQVNVSNLSSFKKFIQICALQSGQLLSMENISKSIGLSIPTIKNWLSILEASYIIHFLEPDINNLGKSLVKTPKLYFVDSGLLCHLLRIENKENLVLNKNKGAVVETFAVSELLKQRYNNGFKANLTFYRDQKGFEIDTIADWKHSFAIEIKSNIESEKKHSANLNKYLKLRGDSDVRGAVFYLGNTTLKIDNITYVSWKDWNKFIQE